MTLFNDIMPYFDEFIHVYDGNMSILWYPLKIWTPKNFTTANFRHPVSKSWLRHCWTWLGWGNKAYVFHMDPYSDLHWNLPDLLETGNLRTIWGREPHKSDNSSNRSLLWHHPGGEMETIVHIIKPVMGLLSSGYGYDYHTPAWWDIFIYLSGRQAI